MDVCRLLRRLGPLACALALVTATPAAGQTSNNDHFADAFWLGTGDLDTNVANEPLSVDDGENLRCPQFPSRLFGTTGWWWYHGSGRPVTISTAGSTFDTILGVYINDSTAGNQIACDDRDPNESVTFQSQLDESYYVQVGTCVELTKGECSSPFFGTVHLLATTPAPVNDNRASAAQLTTGAASTGDTVGSTEEPGETLSCGSADPNGYGRTAWYTWHSPGTGTATFDESGQIFAVIAAYKANSATQLGCATVKPAPEHAHLQIPVEAGDYQFQVGGLGPHNASTLQDSDQGSTTVKLDFVPAPPPAPPAVLAPAAPVPQTPKEAVTASMGLTSYVVHTSRRYTVLHLIASRVSSGTRIEIRCRGRGCPFATRSLTAQKASARLALGGKAMRRAHLRHGAVVEVRFSKPGLLGRVTIYRIRAARLPAQSAQCTLPGGLKVTACPG